MTDLQRMLADSVRAGMRVRGWSQADLAYAAGVSTKHLSQMLNGRVEGTLSTWQHLLDVVDPPPPNIDLG